MANLVAPQPLLNLADPPEDGISSVEFSPTSPDVLLAASWDATVRRYDLNRDRPLVAAATLSLPISSAPSCIFSRSGRSWLAFWRMTGPA